MTGSGKTHFIKRTVLLHLPRVVFHDFKHSNHDLIRSLHFTPAHTPSELVWLLQKNKKRIIYQPGAYDTKNEALEDFDSVCHILFNLGNVALIVDEVGSCVERKGDSIWFDNMMRLGRERGIGVWNMTQRPAWIPKEIITESEFKFLFRLQDDADCVKIGKIVGNPLNYSLYRWRVVSGDIATQEVIKQANRTPPDSDAIKELKKMRSTPLKTAEALRTMPYYHFYQYDGRLLQLHAPVR
jgi:hypothetical protein